MNRLHFHPIRGKALDIIDVILHTEEVMSVGEVYGVIRLVTEELVVNITDYAYPDGGNDFLDVEIERDEAHITLRFCDGGVPFPRHLAADGATQNRRTGLTHRD